MLSIIATNFAVATLAQRVDKHRVKLQIASVEFEWFRPLVGVVRWPISGLVNQQTFGQRDEADHPAG